MSKLMKGWQGKIENIASQIISRDGRHGDHVMQICEIRKKIIFSVSEMTSEERDIIRLQMEQLGKLRRELLELSWAEEYD